VHSDSDGSRSKALRMEVVAALTVVVVVDTRAVVVEGLVAVAFVGCTDKTLVDGLDAVGLRQVDRTVGCPG